MPHAEPSKGQDSLWRIGPVGAIIGSMPRSTKWIVTLFVAYAGQILAEGTGAVDTEPHRLECAFLPNAVQISRTLITGGEPAGEEAFAELARLGVRTVISVDGATPDVEAARRYGLRYVHLPHGYDGISEPRQLELAKAVRDLPGPIYLHCHHGLHRSPAAGAVAGVRAGLIPPVMAERILTLAGTGPNYLGLWEVARSARPTRAEVLDRLEIQFPETSPVPPLAQAMAKMESCFDRVREIEAGDWESPSAGHELLMLEEHYFEMARLDEKPRSENFRALLGRDVQLSRALRTTWEASSANLAREGQRKLSAMVDALAKDCKACHATDRDQPRMP